MARIRTAVLVCCVAALAPTSCTERADDLHREKVVIDRSTTTTDLPCDVPATAERALTEATFGAERLDEPGRELVQGRLDDLRASLPTDLHDEIDVLAGAFDTAFAAGDGGLASDPFDTTEYLVADQAIRRYVDAGCPDS